MMPAADLDRLRRTQRTCDYCGGTFSHFANRLAQYCSAACRQAASRARRGLYSRGWYGRGHRPSAARKAATGKGLVDHVHDRDDTIRREVLERRLADLSPAEQRELDELRWSLRHLERREASA